MPHFDNHVIDVGRGKLSTRLDLRQEDDTGRLRALVREADVFCPSYRAGAPAGRGFGPEVAARPLSRPRKRSAPRARPTGVVSERGEDRP